jgi:hypothetical protein
MIDVDTEPKALHVVGLQRYFRGRPQVTAAIERGDRVKKVIMSLLLVAACRRSTPTVPEPASVMPVAGTLTGAADPMGALRGFMAAAQKADLQALSSFWGDKDGAARDRLPREELEKRELYMVRCLRHDTYEIAGDAPTVGGGRAIVVNVKYRELSRSTDVQIVRGPANRWYVKEVSVTKLQDICMRRS